MSVIVIVISVRLLGVVVAVILVLPCLVVVLVGMCVCVLVRMLRTIFVLVLVSMGMGVLMVSLSHIILLCIDEGTTCGCASARLDHRGRWWQQVLQVQSVWQWRPRLRSIGKAEAKEQLLHDEVRWPAATFELSVCLSQLDDRLAELF